jgi:hypothetical protein
MVEVWLEVTETAFFDEMKEMVLILTKMRKQFFRMLGIEVTIKMMEAASLDAYGLPSGGVIDDR